MRLSGVGVLLWVPSRSEGSCPRVLLPPSSQYLTTTAPLTPLDITTLVTPLRETPTVYVITP